MRLKKCSYQGVMFGRVPRIASQRGPVAFFKESFKRSRQRGINVTRGSFASHRRSQDSAVAGIQVNEGRRAYLKYSYKYLSE